MGDSKVDKYYLKQAKEHIDFLFDKRFLNDDLDMKSIEWLVDYTGLLFQSKAEMAAKAAVLTAKFRDKK